MRYPLRLTNMVQPLRMNPERYRNYDLTDFDAFNRLLDDTRQDQNMAHEVLEECSTCQCCHAHQQHRPSQYEPWIEREPSMRTTYRECQCRCRHLARWVCRNHPDSQYPHPPSSHPASDPEIDPNGNPNEP